MQRDVYKRQWLTSDWIQNAFYTRMLFSCLVDADFQDTQNFMEGAPAPRGGSAAISELLAKVRSRAETYLASNPESPVGRQRNRVLRACIDGGRTLPPGLYTLTVPTGGGKTFSLSLIHIYLAVAVHLPRRVCSDVDRHIVVQRDGLHDGLDGVVPVLALIKHVQRQIDLGKRAF